MGEREPSRGATGLAREIVEVWQVGCAREDAPTLTGFTIQHERRLVRGIARALDAEAQRVWEEAAKLAYMRPGLADLFRARAAQARREEE